MGGDAMIRFTCLCQNRIEVDEDMAGGLFQCPRCGRLNDVPTLSDLPHLADDGTYNVETQRPRDDPLRLAELSIVYSKGTRDQDGDEIDLRMSAAELADPGADAQEAGGGDAGPIPLKGESLRPQPERRPAPRYDPETGEMIRPVELKVDPDQPLNPTAIPVARPAISYASGDTVHRMTTGRVAVDLLMPVNVTVMGFIFIAHVVLQFTGTMTFSGLWMVAFLPLMMAGVIISHYGNVVDEIGPQDRDELPRPLRGCALIDDMWMPFVNVLLALSICFLPAVFFAVRLGAGLPPVTRWALTAVVALVGVVFLPAVLLTSVAGGTVVNLRPDRLVGLMRAAGSNYGLAILGSLLATLTYGFGIFAADLAFIRALTGAKSPLPVWMHLVGYPMLAVGIYFAHLFCWQLGMLYREHHNQFPWAYQRHVRDPGRARNPTNRGTVRDSIASAGPTGANPPRPRKDTKAKLRELRELDRKRRAEQARARNAGAPTTHR
jgi:hypothetical protein